MSHVAERCHLFNSMIIIAIKIVIISHHILIIIQLWRKTQWVVIYDGFYLTWIFFILADEHESVTSAESVRVRAFTDITAYNSPSVCPCVCVLHKRHTKFKVVGLNGGWLRTISYQLLIFFGWSWCAAVSTIHRGYVAMRRESVSTLSSDEVVSSRRIQALLAVLKQRSLLMT